MTAVEHEHGGWLGRSVKRKEDDRFVVGRGNYIEDIKLPGMLMTSYALLERNPNPSEGEIREALSGNLCRCTGYQNIVKAVQQAAAMMKTATSEPAPEPVAR